MWKVFKANPSIRPKLLTSTYDDEELLWIATNQVAEEEALLTAINNNVDYLSCFINPQLYQKAKENNTNTIKSDNRGFKAALEQVLGRKLTDEEFALHVGKK